ncbi:MAG: hypothetical protein J7J72_10820, partial [Bacteroidales bacterium]|nr:hypothetical protein [Bacteroidales bacterium]
LFMEIFFDEKKGEKKLFISVIWDCCWYKLQAGLIPVFFVLSFNMQPKKLLPVYPKGVKKTK